MYKLKRSINDSGVFWNVVDLERQIIKERLCVEYLFPKLTLPSSREFVQQYFSGSSNTYLVDFKLFEFEFLIRK